MTVERAKQIPSGGNPIDPAQLVQHWIILLVTGKRASLALGSINMSRVKLFFSFSIFFLALSVPCNIQFRLKRRKLHDDIVFLFPVFFLTQEREKGDMDRLQF